jgi:hypothetical protein
MEEPMTETQTRGPRLAPDATVNTTLRVQPGSWE